MLLKQCIYLTLLAPSLSYAFEYEDKVCYPGYGSAYPQTFSITKTLATEDNVAGAIVVPRTSTTGSGRVPYDCYCDNPTAQVSHWWSSQNIYPYTTEGDGHWQQITPNLEANIEMYVWNSGGDNYHSVPFIGISNNVQESCDRTGTASTGNTGKVTIRMAKPYVGDISFNGLVAKIWHYRKANYVDYSDPVMVSISLNLNITVPGGCTLLPTSTMTVELGRTNQSEFSGVPYPAAPTSYSPSTFDLKFDCEAPYGELDVTLLGEADSQGQGYKTSHGGISVIVADTGNTILPPNTVAGGVTVDEGLTSSSLKLRAWPTYSGSSSAPEPGKFEAIATIQLNYK